MDLLPVTKPPAPSQSSGATAFYLLHSLAARFFTAWCLRGSLALFAGLLVLAAPLTPTEEARTFVFSDTNLVAELAAAEPDVISPVALAWDADGRMFVAEMRDYPNAPDGGTIRLLEDRDADGRYETATVFADQLSFPNSVLPWNGGVLVTAAPDLLFLKDNDGDGRADERHVLFTGFGTGNQQLRANGLTWGGDGWIYGANGRSDGEIRPVEWFQGQRWVRISDMDPQEAADLQQPVSLRGHDFRIQPETATVQTLAGRSQFGLTRDDWGNRFLSWNTIPVRHEVFSSRLLERNPDLAGREVLVDCSPPGDSGEVFPLTPSPLVFNNESGSHFNALSGLHIFRGDALGTNYYGDAFVGESLRNLVHRRVLVPDGVTFRAERRETRREFLASTDPWFHPVNFGTGPDGALYIADFYRQFVEHPDWVARDTRDRVKWETGRAHGRIWRVRHQKIALKPAGSAIGLGRKSIEGLALELESPNAWRRETALRLIGERREKGEVRTLQRLAVSASLPQTRALALHALLSGAGLKGGALLDAMNDRSPRVREVAIKLAGRFIQGHDLRITGGQSTHDAARRGLGDRIRNLLFDPDDRVKLIAALAMGEMADERIREPALADLANATTNRWLLLAAASSTRSTNAAWLAKLRQPTPAGRPVPAPRGADLDRQRVIEKFTPALQLAGDLAKGAATFAKLCLACHYVQGRGQRVGPDLSGLASRPRETLLVDVLDPSRLVAPDYATYEATRVSGETFTGLIASDSATRLTVRGPGLADINLARTELKELRPTGRSLMPDGLEQGLSPQDFADLLAFLTAPSGSLLPP